MSDYFGTKLKEFVEWVKFSRDREEQFLKYFCKDGETVETAIARLAFQPNIFVELAEHMRAEPEFIERMKNL